MIAHAQPTPGVLNALFGDKNMEQLFQLFRCVRFHACQSLTNRADQLARSRRLTEAFVERFLIVVEPVVSGKEVVATYEVFAGEPLGFRKNDNGRVEAVAGMYTVDVLTSKPYAWRMAKGGGK